jgi:hypothetical protein
VASSKEYMRDYMRRRYERNRLRGLEILGGKCALCDETKNLEFDHKELPLKAVESSRMFYLGDKRFLAEIEKCQLLCRLHHEAKTLADLGQISAKIRHGTLSTYRYCRCVLCRAAHSEYNREYYLSH